MQYDPWAQPSGTTPSRQQNAVLFGTGGFPQPSFLSDVTNLVHNADNTIGGEFVKPAPQRAFPGSASLLDHTGSISSISTPSRSNTPVEVATAVLDDDGATPKQARGKVEANEPATMPLRASQFTVEEGGPIHSGLSMLSIDQLSVGSTSRSPTESQSSPTFSAGSPTTMPAQRASSVSSEDLSTMSERRSPLSASQKGNLSNAKQPSTVSTPTTPGTMATFCLSVVIVEFKMERRQRFRCPISVLGVAVNQYVVVNLENGMQDAGLVVAIYPHTERHMIPKHIPHHEYGVVDRVANEEDCKLINETLPEKEEFALSRTHQLIHFLHLPFMCEDAEYQFDMKVVKVLYSLNPQAYTSIMPNVSRLQRELSFALKNKVMLEQLRPPRSSN